MRDFTRPSGRLRALSFSARLVYSVFVVFTVVGLGLTGWLASELVGADASKTRSYYAGERGEPTVDVAPTAGGPALELPDDESASRPEPMPRRKLLEVTHFHLFSMPVYLLILSHIFMLSRLGERQKAAWIGLGSLATAAHIAAPWLAASGSPGSTAMHATSGAALGASYLVMSVVPLWEMWWPLSSPTASSPAKNDLNGD